MNGIIKTDKYLYFRTDADIAEDDDGGKSACFPLTSFAGAHPTGDSTLTLCFKSMINHDGFCNGTNEVVVSDTVALTLVTANTHREVITAFVNFITSPKTGLLTVADDLGGKEAYFSNLISACGTITVAAANS